MVKIFVWPVSMYGCENTLTWKMRKNEMERLEEFSFLNNLFFSQKLLSIIIMLPSFILFSPDYNKISNLPHSLSSVHSTSLWYSSATQQSVLQEDNTVVCVTATQHCRLYYNKITQQSVLQPDNTVVCVTTRQHSSLCYSKSTQQSVL